MKKILVVVDMQNDFIDGPLGTPEARAIVDNVCAKIRDGEWDYIYYTMDMHDNGYLETQEGQKLPIEHCIYDTEGYKYNAAVEKDILDYPFHTPVYKTTFGCVDLPFLVRSRVWSTLNVDFKDIELTLVGVCTDICVVSNAMLLKAHFPEMKIVVDASCCAGSTPEKHYMALEVMKSCQVDVVNNEWDMFKVALRKTVCETFNIPEDYVFKYNDLASDFDGDHFCTIYLDGPGTMIRKESEE